MEIPAVAGPSCQASAPVRPAALGPPTACFRALPPAVWHPASRPTHLLPGLVPIRGCSQAVDPCRTRPSQPPAGRKSPDRTFGSKSEAVCIIHNLSTFRRLRRVGSRSPRSHACARTLHGSGDRPAGQRRNRSLRPWTLLIRFVCHDDLTIASPSRAGAASHDAPLLHPRSPKYHERSLHP